jgi:hypothetical protein
MIECEWLSGGADLDIYPHIYIHTCEERGAAVKKKNCLPNAIDFGKQCRKRKSEG